MLMRWSLIAALLVVLSVSGTVSAQTAATCQFRTAPGATAAFCETLTAGTSAGGRAGELEDTKWSAGRFDGVYYSGTDLMPFPLAPAAPCKAGVTSVNADNDVLVCDAASGHMGQFETAMSAQDYAVLSLRPRQAFDFTG